MAVQASQKAPHCFSITTLARSYLLTTGENCFHKFILQGGHVQLCFLVHYICDIHKNLGFGRKAKWVKSGNSGPHLIPMQQILSIPGILFLRFNDRKELENWRVEYSAEFRDVTDFSSLQQKFATCQAIC